MAYGILLVEDEETLARNLHRFLQREGYEPRHASTIREAAKAFDEFNPDLVLLDLGLPDGNGLDLLKDLRERNPASKVIVLTGHGTVQTAVDAMKAGAFDYLGKPIALSELKLAVEKALGQERLEETLSYYRGREAREGSLAALLGESQAMEELRGRLGQMLDGDRRLRDGVPPPVLILGETGAGKELVARALHYDGPRSQGPFIELNCAALPAHLLEAELFGHEKGAFTDARERRIGLVEAAHGGTLFLDEIGDLDAAVQAKLLKLLEDRTVRRLGSVRERQVDLRFVAATHRPLESLVREGKFRSDLFFRLSVLGVSVPPLRDRGDDILLLARHFLDQHARRYRRPRLTLAPDAERRLLDHPWPGNVRELRNAMEQAALSATDSRVTVANLALVQFTPPPEVVPADARPVDPGLPSTATLPELERRSLETALQRTKGNVSRAARDLGISRDTMRYRMAKHGPVGE